MEQRTIPLRLGPDLHRALDRIAHHEDQTVGQIIRDAITRDLRRREKAKTSARTDERLVAPLRALLADDLAYSTGWTDLQARLGRKGYTLREAGGGLILCRHPSGNRLCKASELGYSYSALMRRFDAPFPGHRHTLLAQRDDADGLRRPIAR